jgi:hypothetical protein
MTIRKVTVGDLPRSIWLDSLDIFIPMAGKAIKK